MKVFEVSMFSERIIWAINFGGRKSEVGRVVGTGISPGLFERKSLAGFDHQRQVKTPVLHLTAGKEIRPVINAQQ